MTIFKVSNIVSAQAVEPAALLTSNDWDARVSGDNALDATRLTLACLVVLGHSYFLIDNSVERDPLHLLTGGQVYTGHLAVIMFFSISGFLVTRSRLTSRSIWSYLAKRVARIAPGFFMAAIIGFGIVGPLFSTDVASYFNSHNWKQVVLDTLALRQAGVASFEGNIVGLVHGTLWSIRPEFDCYLITAALGGLILIWRAWIVYLAVVLITVLMIANHSAFPDLNYGLARLLISSPHQWPSVFPFFFVGSALYVFRHRVPLSPWLAFASAIAVVGSAFAGGLWWALLFAGTYLALYFSLSGAASPRVFGQRADLSYGVYLYGWMIQQALLNLSGQSLQPLQLTLLALLLTLPVAYVSWHFIERPALAMIRRR